MFANVQVVRPASREAGSLVFRWPVAYDLLLRLVWGRSEDRYRQKLLQLARVDIGQGVLDVGCGTGTLAIAAKGRVGSSGLVSGIDASQEMIARARTKASKVGIEVDFGLSPAESLPFRDRVFDVALSTTVLHCLSEEARPQSIAEMIRVVKPGGRLLLVDFGGPQEHRRSWVSHLHHHGRFDLFAMLPALRSHGLLDLQQGPVGFSDLQFVLTRTPA